MADCGCGRCGADGASEGPPAAEDDDQDHRHGEVGDEVAGKERPDRHLEAAARDRLMHDRTEHVQRREISGRGAVHDHQSHQAAIDFTPLGHAHRERREQRDAGRSQGARHGRCRRQREHDPRHQRAPPLRPPHGRFDDPVHGAVLDRDAKEIGDARQQHKEIDGEAAVHLARRFVHHKRADEERQHERQHAEVDRTQRADDEDERESGDAQGVD